MAARMPICAPEMGGIRRIVVVSCSHGSEDHVSELQSHPYLHSFPTRRSSDLQRRAREGVVVDGAEVDDLRTRDGLHPPDRGRLLLPPDVAGTVQRAAERAGLAVEEPRAFE